METKIYSLKEFSEKIGISRSTLRRWDKKNVFKAYRTPSNYRFYTEEQVKEYWKKAKGE